MIEFVCGGCGAVLKVARAPVGGAVKCPICSAAVPVSAKSHRSAAGPTGPKPPPVPEAQYVTFKCPACGRRLRLGKEYSGIGVKCPHCDASTVVPDANRGSGGQARRTVEDEPSLLKTAVWVAIGLAIVFGIAMVISMDREEPAKPPATKPPAKARAEPPGPVKTAPPASAPAAKPIPVKTPDGAGEVPRPKPKPKPKPTITVAPAPATGPAEPVMPAPRGEPTEDERKQAMRLLRLGNVYLSNGRKPLAAAKYREIIAAYPHTDAGRQAKSKLAECK